MFEARFVKEGLVKIQIEQDFERCESAGAGGMFQVISITLIYEDGSEERRLDLIDQGDMFYDTDEVLDRLGLSNDEISVERF